MDLVARWDTAIPPLVRAVRQPLDRLLMAAAYRHFLSRGGIPDADALVGGPRGKMVAVRAIGLRVNGAFMAAEGADGGSG